MTQYNVLVGVVDLVEADSKEAAIHQLETRLRRDGYEVHEDGTGADQLPHAFESELLTP